ARRAGTPRGRYAAASPRGPRARAVSRRGSVLRQHGFDPDLSCADERRGRAGDRRCPRGPGRPPMKPGDKQRVVARYNRRLAESGGDIRTLSSGTAERRDIRYQILCEVGLRDGVSVLDLGCGFGDLVRYLGERGLKIDYEGCDINPDLIEVARRKY